MKRNLSYARLKAYASLVRGNIALSVKQAGRASMALEALRHAPAVKCNYCRYEGEFLPHGLRPRPDARCPKCGSLDRHRLLKLFLDAHIDLFDGKRLLHFAPEPTVGRYLSTLGCAEYLTADLFRPADLKLNIEAIDLPDDRFDVIICNHVLEHVDDRRALTELYRILAPGGALIAMVPLIEGWETTFEPADIVSEEDRTLFLGHPGHLRLYGRDFADRLRGAGFEAETFVAGGRDAPIYALIRGEHVFLGRKPKRAEN